jgi:DNA mismatch repair protein MutS
MRQYDEAKSAHPDAILFFRMGDFYEMFNQDAVIASRALNLTLTSRNKGDPEEVPMAGVPHHAAAGYVAKLLALGHKVALCEQMADPSKVKGIVPRQVVRVVTPGLITDSEQLDARSNHYLVAVDAPGAAPAAAPTAAPGSESPVSLAAAPPQAFGLALLDLSTGELLAASIQGIASLLAELARADPREVLFAQGLEDLQRAASLAAPRAALRDDDPLDPSAVQQALDDALGEAGAEDALREHPPLALRAAARALRFARRCTPGAAIPVRRVAPYDPSGALRIDETAQTHLELVAASDGSKKGSLLEVIDTTVTPSGARALKRRLLAPLADVGLIRRRLDEVELFVTHARARTDLREALSAIGDLERLSVRAVLREATPRDLGALRDGLAASPRAIAAVQSIPEPAAGDLFGAGIDPVADVCARLTATLVDRPPTLAREGGLVRDGFDPDLDELRKIKTGGTELIVALEAKLRAQTNATSLRVRYTRVFGWYIEVTKTHLAKVPATWRRKQTIAGGERYTNDELDELADRIEHAETRALEREASIFESLLDGVAKSADRIRALARCLAGWDVAAALADVAHRNDYCRPEIDAGDAIVIRDGRHPVVERYAAAGRFVPNDTVLDLGGERLQLITGPNMAGKSTLMRQVAHIVILAQAGSYVPARSARIGLVDRILSRVGASDNVARGESTFMVEMRETASILREATRRSLVILDEIVRRPCDRVGGGRAHGGHRGVPGALRDALSRAHGSREDVGGGGELLGGGARARRGRGVPSQAHAWPCEPELWHCGGAPGGSSGGRSRAGEGHSHDARDGRGAPERQARDAPGSVEERSGPARFIRGPEVRGARGVAGGRDASGGGRGSLDAAGGASARGQAQGFGSSCRERAVAGSCGSIKAQRRALLTFALGLLIEPQLSEGLGDPLEPLSEAFFGEERVSNSKPVQVRGPVKMGVRVFNGDVLFCEPLAERLKIDRSRHLEP